MSRSSETPIMYLFEGVEIWTQYWYNICRGGEKQMTIQIGDYYAQCRYVNGNWTVPEMGKDEVTMLARRFLENHLN